MRLFETGFGPDWVASDLRVYGETFPQQTARSIGWELNLVYPTQDRRIDYEIEAVYFRSDGSVLGRQTLDSYADEGWTRSQRSSARGWRSPKQWKPGVYSIELSIEGDVVASGEFEIIDRPIPRSGPFLDLQDRLPWADYPLDLNEERAMIALSGIMDNDSSLASNIASLKWMQQSLTKEGLGTLQALDTLARVDVNLAKQVIGFSWLNDDVTRDEWLALRTLTLLAKRDVALARSMTSLSWLQDDVTEDERWTMRNIYVISILDRPMADILLGFTWLHEELTEEKRWTVSNIRDIWVEKRSMAWFVLGFPWLRDDLTIDERRVVRAVRDVAKEDLPSAQEILRLQWLTDQVSKDERLTLAWLRDIAQEDLNFARTLMAFPWFADHISEDERSVVGWVRDIVKEDLSAAQTLMDFPWLLDNVSIDERKAVGWVRDIVKEDLLPADVLLGLPWLADDVTWDESATIRELRDLGRLAPRVAATFVRMDFFQGPIVRFHSGTIEAVSELYEVRPEQAAQLTSLRWFASGLDYHEAALVLILPDIAKADTLFNELVPTRAARSQLVHLPLAGDVKLTLIRRPSLQDSPDTFDSMGLGLGLIEEFMQVPWPNPDVILLVEPELELARENPPSGFYTHTHMVIDTPETSPRFNYTLYHELGHYYFSSINVPRWLSESGSDFLEFYVREQAHELDLVQYKGLVQSGIEKDCSPHDITNIQDLLDATEGLETKEVKLLPSWPCHYEIGEVLLLHLYESFGRESVSGTLRDLHLLGKSERRPVSEAEIYQAFLANTPPGQEAEFNELYQRLHGGPIPGT